MFLYIHTMNLFISSLSVHSLPFLKWPYVPAGARVSEQYCGSPEVLEDSLQVLEDKCYSNDISWDDRRTQTSFCYCSSNLCNVSSHLLVPSWSFLAVLVVVVMLSTTMTAEHVS